MRLSTLECVKCSNTFTEDLDMWHVIDHALQAGWTVLHDERAICPHHGLDSQSVGMWVVGCDTCFWEEEFESEDMARYEHATHSCEWDPDTYIYSPQEVAQRMAEATRAQEEDRARRQADEESAHLAAEAALARQQRIERYAANWIRLTNFFHPWRKENL